VALRSPPICAIAVLIERKSLAARIRFSSRIQGIRRTFLEEDGLVIRSGIFAAAVSFLAAVSGSCWDRWGRSAAQFFCEDDIGGEVVVWSTVAFDSGNGSSGSSLLQRSASFEEGAGPRPSTRAGRTLQPCFYDRRREGGVPPRPIKRESPCSGVEAGDRVAG